MRLAAGLAVLAACVVGPSWAPVHAAAPARTPDAMEATLAGEYALQAGRLDEAATWYLKAAQAAEGDAGLAERATRIGLLASDDKRSRQALALWHERAPRSLAMRAAEATLAMRDGDAPKARARLEALLRDPDPRGWRHALSVLAGGGKDQALSARVLGELVDAGAIPDQLQPWLAFGGLAQRLGEDALAKRIVDDVVERFPGEPRVALLHASQLRESGDRERARGVLAEIAARPGLGQDLRLAVAAEYDALGDFPSAAEVMSRGPQDEQSYRMRAAMLAKAEDKAALTSLYQDLKRDSADPDPSRRLLLGQTAEFLERHAEALEWYRSVPGGEARWQARMRAITVLHKLGSRQEAFEAVRQLQQDASASDETRRDAYLLEAELHKDDDDFQGELDAYARGLAAFSDEPALLYARGLMWERRDDIPRAEADLRRILVADPENVAALNALGYTLADRTSRYAEALELIDRARAAEPDNAAIIDSYGWVLFRLGRLDEALVELKRAFTMQKDPEIGAHLGEVLWRMGRKQEAREYFEQARKLDPENRSLKRALAETGAAEPEA
ncbi:tetratricopeptide repeat protein [Luteimonas vadosa]|uniref:Tetratricopeptide repeat protein n=1 Tax=Luteimonas vadosa TaxID=1165507 RepID=A0ABP9E6Q5_9GAMM